MRLLTLVLALPLLAGCVAPEPEPVKRIARPAAPARTDLEPAPTANRAVKQPEGQPVILYNGIGKTQKPNLPETTAPVL